MQESGQLHSLKEKWWKLKNKGDQCEVRKKIIIKPTD